MPLWPYVIDTRILADHLESLVVKSLSTSGLHIIEQNTLYFGFESPWNLWLLIFGKFRWKLMRTRHGIAFCLCALHIISNANLYYGKESNGFKIQDNACKRGLKIDPEQEFTKLLLTIILFWKVHILFCPFTLKQQKWLSTFEEESNTTTKKSITP